MRHLITSALPYINGIKHLGNLIGSMLPADVYARFLRQRGEDVLYICATDEHGAPAELAAEAAGQDVAAYCAEQHGVQRDIYARFSISFDHFGRTSDPENHEITQQIARQLEAGGHLQAREIDQVYSATDGRFLPDRYVTGTCPHCGYEAARGDQCESCTRLLDPTDLVDPRSTISGATDLEVRSTRHLFLALEDLEPRLREWLEATWDQWPALSRQIAGKWLGEGLQNRCITRDLRWGVSVPMEGFEGKVFYVWFDAPIGYISATRQWAESAGRPDAWRGYWVDAEDIHYTQFMGKDNLPFHTVMFPGTLLGASTSWKLPDQIKGFHWLQYCGGKFSTSQQRGVFTDAALDVFPADYWRYYLMANAPETADSNFTWELFANTVNKDLAGIFGNFANRVLQFTRRKFCTKGTFGLEIPPGGVPGEAEEKLAADCAEQVAAYERHMAALEFRPALRALRTLWTLGNLYIDAQAPWSVLKTDRDQAAMIIRTCLNLIKLNGVAALPVIPNLAGRLLDGLQLSEEERAGPPSAHLDLTALAPGRPFTVIPPLIGKIDADAVAAMKERFGGG